MCIWQQTRTYWSNIVEVCILIKQVFMMFWSNYWCAVYNVCFWSNKFDNNSLGTLKPSHQGERAVCYYSRRCSWYIDTLRNYTHFEICRFCILRKLTEFDGNSYPNCIGNMCYIIFNGPVTMSLRSLWWFSCRNSRIWHHTTRWICETIKYLDKNCNRKN